MGTVALLAVGGPALAAATSPNPLQVTTRVVGRILAADPETSAVVVLTVSVKNPDGSPAKDAAVRISNTKPGVTFRTNASGALTLGEPITMPINSGGTRT